MRSYKIALIVGSLRRESFNKRLADALVALAPDNVEFTRCEIGDLPLYNQDDDDNQPDSVKRLKQQIRQADGVLFVTPEYNRSIPGVLKNAIDHASRPYGESAWAGKPAGIIGISIGSMGTSLAQQHLRNILAVLDVPTMAQPEAYLHMHEGFFDVDGSVSAASREFLQNWMAAYLGWVKQFAQTDEHIETPETASLAV